MTLLFLLVLAVSKLSAQDDLMTLLQKEIPTDSGWVVATFKGTRLVNGHSVEMRTKGTLDFIIGHRFGTINSGHREFWGLDQANIRLGLVYGMTDNFSIGIGRSSFNKVIDLLGKYRILRQSDSHPVSIGILGGFARKTIQGMFLEGSNRHSYTLQMLIARKFNAKFSFQFTPTIIQRNLVESKDDDNLLIAAGMGARYKLSNRVSVNAEYYPQLSNFSNRFQNALAVGFDIETGGHIFQLHVTNAIQLNEPGFVGETTSNFFDGDIHFGFNISRVFSLKR